MLNLFFVPSIDSSEIIVVAGEEAHHALKVLRMNVGEELLLSDREHNWVRGTISSMTKNEFMVNVSELCEIGRSQPELIVIQALPKSDRVKETIELLTEAGADRIIPWQSDRAISKWQDDSLAKWSAGAMAASKQSRRFRIPTVAQPFAFSQAMEFADFDTTIIVFHESAKEKLSEIFASEKVQGSERIVIVIGPEGGLTDGELDKFSKIGGQIAHMGEPVFRSAHAGAAGLAAIQALIGRW